MVSDTIKKYSTVLGCVLIHIVLGTLYTCGNINSYFTSYIFNETGNIVNMSLASWLFSLSLIGLTLFMPIGGILDNKFGCKITITIGSIIIFLAVFGTYFYMTNYIYILLTFGLLFGLGCSLCYSTCISVCMKWFPKQAGLISGIIVMGYGCGALIFNNVQTLSLNPDNLSTILDETSGMKFYPVEVTNRLPFVILMLASIYTTMLIAGILLIQVPSTSTTSATSSENNKEDSIQNTVSSSQETTEHTIHEPLISLPLEGITIKEAIKTYKFWEIWMSFFCVVQVVLFISSFYKYIAQEFISDDQFLALIGSISSLCNGLSRPIWGSLVDKFGYKIIMSCITFLLGAFISSLTYIKPWGSIVYMLWVCIIYFSIGGIFAVFPVATKSAFGQKYFSSIYGFICTSEAASSLVFSLSSSLLLNALGYTGTTLLIGGICVATILLITLSKSWTYKQIDISKDIESN